MSSVNLITNTTPLAASAAWTSSIQQLTRATEIVGSVIADEPGTLYIDQSGDGTHFDITESYAVTPNIGVAIETDVIDQWFRVRYINGANAQAVFRLFVNIMDPYGDFLVAQSGPSAGGNWVVLFLGPAGYQFVGRFNGSDGWNANQNAALFQNKSGQYASVPVANFTATIETVESTTEHSPATF